MRFSVHLAAVLVAEVAAGRMTMSHARKIFRAEFHDVGIDPCTDMRMLDDKGRPA